MTLTDVVFDALEHHRDSLPAILAAYQRPVARPQTDALFQRTPLRTSRSSHPTADAQVCLRVTPDNRQVLEDLVRTSRAKSLGQLVRAVLETYLPAPR